MQINLLIKTRTHAPYRSVAVFIFPHFIPCLSRRRRFRLYGKRHRRIAAVKHVCAEGSALIADFDGSKRRDFVERPVAYRGNAENPTTESQLRSFAATALTFASRRRRIAAYARRRHVYFALEGGRRAERGHTNRRRRFRLYGKRHRTLLIASFAAGRFEAGRGVRVFGRRAVSGELSRR